ncbi:flagellar basal body P-ring formation chaperone FlgA [Parvularcula lutaonensis]|uniref:Flagella basal body P-ring formation protein FlgA n=1 Tax=Parvularcula lutaonensis TaxID=491923 RepID=A0ABV7MCF2_9PROT|nr:flagellar basal body P-ring formation chaperone FlgA [Parvularcula lutaonensis]GGY50667.1 hypothetical protein GCM10007148_19340 [Parvularcula lutaonensis]
MIRSLLAFFAFIGVAFAQAPLPERVADAIREGALLPMDAEVKVLTMTRVVGEVEAVELVRFDRRTGNYEAIISHRGNQAKIKGRASVSVPVVVASRTLRRDHVIGPADLEVRNVSIAQVPADAFSMVEDAVGMSVKRSLVAGRPVREDDVGAPIVLRKNEAVEIVYERKGMVLSARGRALDEGAVGDAVRVVTDGQEQVVMGEVAGPGVVAIR